MSQLPYQPIPEPDSEGNVPLSRSYLNRIARAVAGLLNFSGQIAYVDSDGIHLRRGLKPSRKKIGFWAQITGSSADGTNRWKYSWKRLADVKASAGYGGWQDADPSETGNLNARNTLEDMNAATGTQGNGVDVANLDTDEYTFTIQACPSGAKVWMREVDVEGETDTEFWFLYANGVDGECD